MSGDRPAEERPARLGRRAFLGSAALGSAAVGAAALAACTQDAEPPGPAPGRRVAFLGDHQPGFLAVQARLKGEPMEEYILPVGGGFFFAPPGVTSGDTWLGQRLLDVD